MIQGPYSRDLIVLAADKDAEMTLRGLFSRPPALGIRPLGVDYLVHPNHDPGCYCTAIDFIRQCLKTHAYALVVFDRHGCGADQLSREEIERRVEESLFENGWSERAAALALDPELEVWLWSDSPHVDAVLGWAGHKPSLRDWLRQTDLWPEGRQKPPDPKEALERSLRHVDRPRSAAVFQQIAKRVSLQRCTDAAFDKLRRRLRQWFPAKV